MTETNIYIHPGSVFDVPADAIVNPANSFLRHDGGLARLVCERATTRFDANLLRPLLVAELKQARTNYDALIDAWRLDHESAPLIAVGNAYHTSPGALPFKGVIHAVGPIWNGGGFMERDLLETAHESVLRVAQEHNYTSVVFPAILCGVFGFPVEEAAKIAVEVVSRGIDYGVRHVTFAVVGDGHLTTYHDAYRRLLL